MVVKIKHKEEITKDILRVEFDIGKNIINFKPGQHMIVTLINPPESDNAGNRRYFSIVNSPLEKNVLVITTRLRNSAFIRVLKNLPIGSEVDISEIGGNFILTGDTTIPLVFIAENIGITPFISMLSYIDELSLTYKITLLFSNNDKYSTPYFDYLSKLGKKNRNIKIIFISGRINSKLIKKYFPNPNNYVYYIAGPTMMVKSVYQEVLVSGVNTRNIKTENFIGYENEAD